MNMVIAPFRRAHHHGCYGASVKDCVAGGGGEALG